MNTQLLFYGGTVTFMVMLFCTIAILFSFRVYRPEIRIRYWFSSLLLVILFSGVSSLQAVASYQNNEDKETEIGLYYKTAKQLQQKDDDIYPLLTIKELWDREATVDMKLFLAAAYLKNGQEQRANRLLNEVEKQSADLDIIKSSTVSALQNASLAKGEDSPGIIESTLYHELDSIKSELKMRAGKASEELELISLLDVNYLSYQVKIGEYTSSYQEQISRQAYEEVMEAQNELRLPEAKLAVAEYAVFINDYETAENLLASLIQAHSQDVRSITLLAELYLGGSLQPGPSVVKLPQFQRAEQRALREYLKIYGGGYNDPGATTAFNYEQTLSNELVYALIDPLLHKESNFLLDVRMSRYHFNKGDSNASAAFIQKMHNKKEQMTPYQQFVMRQVEMQDTGKEIVLNAEQREETYFWRQEAYDIMHTPKLHRQPTVEDQSYTYYLSDRLRNPQMRHVSITSIEAADNGEITLYVQANNIQELTKQTLHLMDNHNKIEQFQLMKMSESTNLQRSIAMVIDTSGSMAGNRIETASQAAVRFLAQLKGYEQAELIAFNDSANILQSMTGNKRALVHAARGLEGAGGTNITDAFLFSIDRLKDQRGQKILFMFTDGEDEQFSMTESRSQIIQLARREGIPVYAVGFSAGYETLSEVAEGTGGQFIAAPNVSTILNGFNYVAKTLETTYKVTYTIPVTEAGKHTVNLTALREGVSAERDYTFGDHAWSDDNNVVKPLPDDGQLFDVDYVVPSAIYRANTGDSLITLYGSGLKKTANISIDKLPIQFRIKNDSQLELQIPNTLTEGDYKLNVAAEDGRRTTVTISVLEPRLMQSIKFGWSTIYGRTITPDKTQSKSYKIAGDPSVDKFIYPSSSVNQMVLKDGSTLSFQGLMFGIDKTKLDLKGQLLTETQHLTGSYLLPTVMLTLEDYGEHFTISSLGIKHLTFNRVGLEFALADIKYQAKKAGAGTVTAKTGFANNDSVQQYLKLPRSIQLFPINELTLTATIEPDSLGIEGQLGISSIGKQKFLVLEDAALGVEYEFTKNRLLMSGGFSKLFFLNKPIPGKLSGVEFTLGWENSAFAALGVKLEGMYLLGTSGFTLTELGMLVDFSSAAEGRLDFGVGTVADAVKPYILKLNSIKIAKKSIFDISNFDAGLLNLEGSLGIASMGTNDWEFNGTVDAKMFGFTLGQTELRLTNQLFKAGIRADALLGELTGDVVVIYSDPRRNEHMTIGLDGKISALTVGLLGRLLVVPEDIHTSAYFIGGTAFGEEFELTSGGDITVFK